MLQSLHFLFILTLISVLVVSDCWRQSKIKSLVTTNLLASEKSTNLSCFFGSYLSKVFDGAINSIFKMFFYI